MTKEMTLPDRIAAPIQQGEKLGELSFYLDGQCLGTVSAVSRDALDKAGVLQMYGMVLQRWING